jgi:hypothetical protein
MILLWYLLSLKFWVQPARRSLLPRFSRKPVYEVDPSPGIVQAMAYSVSRGSERIE